MIKIFTFFVFLISLQFINAQKYFSGQVLSENGTVIANADVINMSTSLKVSTDNNGRFLIQATTDNELRIVKKGYERISHFINYDDFGRDFITVLKPQTIAIDEIDIGKVMTGNIKKDIKKVTNVKTETLNTNLAIYMKTPLMEVVPKATIPQSFQNPKLDGASLDLVKTATFISKLIMGESNLPPVFNPTDLQRTQFYVNLKQDLGDDYFKSINIKEADIDLFLQFAEGKLRLCSRYYQNYNVSLIIVELEKVYQDFSHQEKLNLNDVKNHKTLAKIQPSKFGFGTINVAT